MTNLLYLVLCYKNSGLSVHFISEIVVSYKIGINRIRFLSSSFRTVYVSDIVVRNKCLVYNSGKEITNSMKTENLKRNMAEP